MANDNSEIGQDAGEDATAAKVVSDMQQPVKPGGGGGASAASDPLDQADRGGAGSAPGSPIDVESPHPEGSPATIGHEAAQRAGGDAPEPKPASR